LLLQKTQRNNANISLFAMLWLGYAAFIVKSTVRKADLFYLKSSIKALQEKS